MNPMRQLLRYLLLCTLLSLSACSQFDDEEHEKNILLGMLAHKNYAELEQALIDTDSAYKEQTLSTKDWQARWYAVANVSTGGVEKRMNDWVGQAESGHALLMRGMWRQVQAWRQLEDEPETGTEQKRQQAELVRLSKLAEADLLAAQKKLDKCALCLTELITVRRGLGLKGAESQTLLEQALTLDPLLSSAIFSYFTNLYPEWGGSFEQMRQFIDQMKARGLDETILMGLESRYSWLQSKAALQREDKDKAFAWLERGVTSAPYDVLMIELATVYTELGMHDKAVKTLETNLELNNPWDVRTIDLLVRAYVKTQERDKADEMIAKRALALLRDSRYQ